MIHQESSTQYTDSNETVEVVVCDNESVAGGVCTAVCMEKKSNGNSSVVGSNETINEKVSLFDGMNFTEKSAAMKKAFHEYLKRASHEDMK